MKISPWAPRAPREMARPSVNQWLKYLIIMKSRRQEKVARIIKESVSDCIANHLSDPRIEGLVSVTKVDVSPDLRNVDVYLSVYGKDESSQNKTYNAIVHATKRIQTFMAHDLQSRFCPILHFKNDDNFKKTLETMRLIDEAVGNPYSEPETDEENDLDDSDDIEDIDDIEETEEDDSDEDFSDEEDENL